MCVFLFLLGKGFSLVIGPIGPCYIFVSMIFLLLVIFIHVATWMRCCQLEITVSGSAVDG